jgi:hypothetical protein
MNRFFLSPKFLVAVTLATAALGGATAAEARPDVYFSVGFQNGPAWVEPAPAYEQPRAVYVQPAPVYLRAPVFIAPREGFGRPRRGGYDARYQWEHQRAWRYAEWRRHERHEHFGDRDRGRGDRKWHDDQRD